MASYLRPRRGKAATATNQKIVLKRGEVFFEVPSGGVGTGVGKIKMGDGSSAYSALPYFMDPDSEKIGFTNNTAADSNPFSNSGYLNNIVPGNNLKTIFTNLKKLLLNYNSALTSLNNDLIPLSKEISIPIVFNITNNGSVVTFAILHWLDMSKYSVDLKSVSVNNLGGVNYGFSPGFEGYGVQYYCVSGDAVNTCNGKAGNCTIVINRK